MSDIEYWKTELSHETDAMLDETAQLDKARKALETFLKESENQVHIARECLYNREKRQGKNNSIPYCKFEPEFSELLSQNQFCVHLLSIEGNSKMMHCGMRLTCSVIEHK